MSEDNALRFSRQLSLPQIGSAGQARLANSAVLIVGLGGLGSAASLYAANSGIGHLLINDFDRIDITNLPRQILFSPANVGDFKTSTTARALKVRNPDIEITELNQRLRENELGEVIDQCDVILDCTDNFASRTTINKACFVKSKPLVSGAAIRFEGQLTVFRADRSTGPCYNCLYTEEDDNLEDCAGQGILAPVAGTIGCMIATEAIKVLVGLESDLAGKLWAYDGLTGAARAVKIRQRPGCRVCG
jgi:molybdopterin/thiamine biosynthesis adenylyltransferase